MEPEQKTSRRQARRADTKTSTVVKWDNEQKKWITVCVNDSKASDVLDHSAPIIVWEADGPVPSYFMLRLWGLVTMISILTCAISFSITNFASFVKRYRLELQKVAEHAVIAHGYSTKTPLVVWVVGEIILICTAHGISRVAPGSYGSGLAEIRCELQGTHLIGYYSRRTLLAKLLGLAVGSGSDLPVGLEGPLVHIAAALAAQLIRLPCFSSVVHIPGNTKHLLSAATAIGTAATLGVPIGSVLFALEVLPDSVWENTVYVFCIGAAVIACFTLRVFETLQTGSFNMLVPQTNATLSLNTFNQEELSAVSSALALLGEVVLCVAYGLVAGLFGALFISSSWRINEFAAQFQARGEQSSFQGVDENQLGLLSNSSPLLKVAKPKFPKGIQATRNRIHRHQNQFNLMPLTCRKLFRPSWSLFLCALVGSVLGCCTYLIPWLRFKTQSQLLQSLFTPGEIDFSLGLPDETYIRRHPALVCGICLMVRYIATLFTLALRVPAGCIAPLYVIGGLMGYFTQTGIALSQVHANVNHGILMGTCFTAAVCRSFSVVVVICEMAGFSKLTFHLAISSIVSIYVANVFTPSIFDLKAYRKALPASPQKRSMIDGEQPVGDLVKCLSREIPVFPQVVDKRYLQKLLERLPLEYIHLGITMNSCSSESSCLLGAVTRQFCQDTCDTAADDKLHFKIGEMQLAPVVPPDLTIQKAKMMFDCYACSLLFVMQNGSILGVLTFQDILCAEDILAGFFVSDEGNARTQAFSETYRKFAKI